MTYGQRERIVVAANDTLESVLDRLRACEAGDLVLDVDERSPLLLSLQHLHQLEEVAQEHDVHVTIGSANSKLLNAARVFGIAAIDYRVEPPVAPLDAAGITPVEPSPLAGAGVLESGNAAGSPVEAPAQELSSWPVGEEPDSWDDATQPARLTRATPAPPVVARLDPYGQPYADEPAPATVDQPARRRIGWAERIIRPTVGRPPEPDDERDWAAAADDGWDDADDRDEPDDEAFADAGEFVPAQPPRRGLIALVDGLRLRFRAPRRAPVDVPGDLDHVAGVDDTDDREAGAAGGWDTPADRPQAATSAVPLTIPPRPQSQPFSREPLVRDGPEIAENEDDGDEGEDVDAGGGWTRRRQAERRAIAAAPDDDEDDGWVAPARRPRRRAGGALGSLLVLLLPIALAGVVALYFLLASATVTLVARTGTVNASLMVVVGEIDPNSPQGQPTAEQIVSPAKRLTVPVSATATIPSTGFRLEPDVTAGGPVVFSNAATAPVTVPKGTVLTAVDGSGYITLEGVTVPAADPFNSAAFGTVTVKVAANTRGSAGNADTGTVRGQLPSGIFYNNRNAPIAGGSDRKIPVVSKQDRAAAQASAAEAARAKGAGAIAAVLPPGSTQLPGTAGVGNFTVEYGVAEGSDGTAVTATVNGEATALVYTQADVDSRARTELEKRLAAGVKPGEALIPGSMRLEAPQLVEETPGIRKYRVSGTAQSRAAIGGDRERDQLAGQLAGKSDEDARTILQQLPSVSSYTIAYAPGWFPQRMPWRASKIDIRIAEPSR